MNVKNFIKELKRTNPLKKRFDPDNPEKFKKEIYNGLSSYMLDNDWPYQDNVIMSSANLWLDIEKGLKNELFSKLFNDAFSIFKSQLDVWDENAFFKYLRFYIGKRKEGFLVESKFADAQGLIRSLLVGVSKKGVKDIPDRDKVNSALTYIGKVTEQCCKFYLDFLISIIFINDDSELKKKSALNFGSLLSRYIYQNNDLKDERLLRFKDYLALSDLPELSSIKFHQWRNFVQHGSHDIVGKNKVQIQISEKERYECTYKDIYSVAKRLNLIYSALNSWALICSLNIDIIIKDPEIMQDPSITEILSEKLTEEEINSLVDPQKKREEQKRQIESFNTFDRGIITFLFSQFFWNGYLLDNVEENEDRVNVYSTCIKKTQISADSKILFMQAFMTWTFYKRNINMIIEKRGAEERMTIKVDHNICLALYSGSIDVVEFFKRLENLNVS